MYVVIARTVILFAVVVTVTRLMGKREIGQLQPAEFVVALMISELAAIPMQDTGIPLVNGLMPILLILALQSAISYANLKSETARAVFCGKPSILIHKGQIDAAELYRQNYNLNDLLEQLRAKNFPNIGEVEYAILETNGQLSVLPKPQNRPLTAQDMNVVAGDPGLPVGLILDGKVNRQNLAEINKDMAWLTQQLENHGYPADIGKIFLASYDNNGQFFIQLKQVK